MPTPSYSDEQATYIHHTGFEDTKLLATAGSGKTFCIIHHILNILKLDINHARNICILTFSKNAKEDFVSKLMRGNHNMDIPPSCVHTIDSFAWKAMGERSKSIDVSILSYTFLKLLECVSMHQGEIEFPSLQHITRIYVDEAQDLNETQYNILIQLKNKFNCTIHLIGDPNQNIYQFRKASDRYLVEFPAKVFHLTRNYRSKGHIVEFCSPLRPYNDAEISYSQISNLNMKVMFYAYDSHQTFEHYILAILHTFIAKNIPLHKCAILAPTRGYIRAFNGITRFKGLCFISNLLCHNNIPFSQFYNDDCRFEDDINISDAPRIKYRPSKGKINLMTFTSSKGLEWDYVILLDANAHLISKRDYDMDKYNAEKYLLYVACSRPCKNLIVFTGKDNANPWLKEVPEEKYCIAKKCAHNFSFFDADKLFDNKNSNNNKTNNANNLQGLIGKLSEKDLYTLHNLIGKKVNMTLKCLIDDSVQFKYKSCYTNLVKNFMRHAFIVYTSQSLYSSSLVITDIQNIISKTNVLTCNNDIVIKWYYSVRDTMTWESWDKDKKRLGFTINNFVENYMEREMLFNSYTLVDKFYSCFIGSNIAEVKCVFEKYNTDPTNPELMLYLVLTSYAIQTSHYFYLKHFNIFKEDILQPGNLEFLKILKRVSYKRFSHSIDEISKAVIVEEIKMVIDMISKEKTMYSLKVVKNLTFKDTLFGLLSFLLYHGKYTDTRYYFKAFNIETMIIHVYNVEHLEVEEIDEIFGILLGTVASD